MKSICIEVILNSFAHSFHHFPRQRLLVLLLRVLEQLLELVVGNQPILDDPLHQLVHQLLPRVRSQRRVVHFTHLLADRGPARQLRGVHLALLVAFPRVRVVLGEPVCQGTLGDLGTRESLDVDRLAAEVVLFRRHRPLLLPHRHSHYPCLRSR